MRIEEEVCINYSLTLCPFLIVEIPWLAIYLYKDHICNNNKSMKIELKCNILVIGGSSGIGYYLCELLNGYQLTEVSRRGNSLPNLRSIKLDVTDYDELKKLLEMNHYDIIFYCAGIPFGTPLVDSDYDASIYMYKVNFFIPLEIIKTVAAKETLFVVLGSVAGEFSLPYNSYYCASKHALLQAIRIAKLESPFLRVNYVMLGPNQTGFTFKREVSKRFPYCHRYRKAINVLSWLEQKGQSPHLSAQRIINRISPKKTVIFDSFKTRLLYFLLKALPSKIQEILIKLVFLKKP